VFFVCKTKLDLFKRKRGGEPRKAKKRDQRYDQTVRSNGGSQEKKIPWGPITLHPATSAITKGREGIKPREKRKKKQKKQNG